MIQSMMSEKINVSEYKNMKNLFVCSVLNSNIFHNKHSHSLQTDYINELKWRDLTSWYS